MTKPLETQTPEVNPLENPVVGTPAPAEQTIPKHRFDEVYSQMKALKEQVETFQAERATKEKEELEATNQFKALYEQTSAELEALKAKTGTYENSVNTYEATINSMVDTKLSTVPEQYRALVPANLSPVEKLDWINKAETTGLFGAKPTVVETPIGQPTPAEPQTVDYTKLSAEELLHMAYSNKK